MKYNHNATGRALSMPAGFAIGLCLGFCTTLILSAILAKLVSSEKLEWGTIGYGIMVILLITSVIDAKTTCLMIKRRKLISCMLAGFLYWLALLMTTALFFGGQYSGMGVAGVIILCGSALVYVFELKGEKGRKATSHRILTGKRS